MNKSFFFPADSKYINKYEPIEIKHNYKNKQFCFKPSFKPFFSVINENETSKSFVDAILKDSIDDAKSYISKNSIYEVCFEEIKTIFKDKTEYKELININFNKNSHYKVNSLLISDKECKNKEIIHIYLINEPDNFSRWKIFKIEKE